MKKNLTKILTAITLSFALAALTTACSKARANDANVEAEKTKEAAEADKKRVEIRGSESDKTASAQQDARVINIQMIRPERLDVQILVNGSPREVYESRGHWYIEAAPRSEYAIRIRNPLGVRVAVALSVDGLNTIDARRTSAAEASKWVIEPYGSITVGGWQMSGSRARKFYFTTERDSYGAKLGRTADLGVISAVFFREQPRQVYTDPRDRYDRAERRGNEPDDAAKSSSAPSSQPESAKESANEANRAEARRAPKGVVAPAPSDEYAATGIGRNVHNSVERIWLPLEPHPFAEIALRYEYHDTLVRLGVLPPRPYYNPDPLPRRERATGFSDGNYCPDPK